MRYIRARNVYKLSIIDECLRVTGKPPIKVRWVDTNKGDGERSNYRSRLVAMEFRVGKMDFAFAATPPLEALQALFQCRDNGSIACERGKRDQGINYSL